MPNAYCIKTGASVPRQESPLEPGVFLLPANSTEIAPPDFDASTHACFFDGTDWVITEISTPEPIPAMDQLRQQRNQLLAATDWRMVSDYPGANQTEWQTYRQALRDITTQTPSLDSNGNLTGITWPTPPND